MAIGFVCYAAGLTNTVAISFDTSLEAPTANIKLLNTQTLPNLTLKGELTQGSLIRGKVPPMSKVKLNDNLIKVSANGDFTIGFGRDAAILHKLSWQLSEASSWHTHEIVLSKREYEIDRIEGVAQKYVSPAKEVLERISQENRQIAAARAYNSDLLYFTQNFILPAQGRISGVYGSQRFFNGSPRRPHFGLDVANSTGTPVIAPVAGIVRLSHDDMYYSGGTLIIDHGFGVSSTFIHLSKLHVEEGQVVEQGQLIAEIGATGRVTGPHLDWRINWFRERVDPALLVTLPLPE
jgi:murein DD-endopeptidase MepM/ murein hydrolase activator NlpD